MGPLSGGGVSTAVGEVGGLVLNKWYLAAWEQPLGAVR